jgi:ABC-type multidrug transport system fused ATPase/permease subunit
MLNLQKMRDVTVLFVTHRFSTISYVDRVLMLQEGSLVAVDTPEGIAASSVDFRRLFDITDADEEPASKEPPLSDSA